MHTVRIERNEKCERARGLYQPHIYRIDVQVNSKQTEKKIQKKKPKYIHFYCERRVRTLPKKANDKQNVKHEKEKKKRKKRKKTENKLKTNNRLIWPMRRECARERDGTSAQTMSENDEMSGAKMCTLMRKEMWLL